MTRAPEDGLDGAPDPGEREWERIVAYVMGKASPEESRWIEERSASDAAFGERLEQARRAWERSWRALEPPVPEAVVERAWARMAAAMAAGKAAVAAASGTAGSVAPAAGDVLSFRPRPLPVRASRWRRVALAASVLLAVGAGATWLTLRWERPVEVREVVAMRGERLPLTLPDGSHVVLGPGSSIRSPERFARDARTVVLTGQAYFDVAHDPDRPFRISTNAAEVEVLGTEFDLRAFPSEQGATLIVRSGRVAVRAAHASPERSRVVTSGQQATIDSTGALAIEPVENVDALLGWTSGRLAFERMPLEQMAAELERWHPVDVEIADSVLGERRVTAAFEHDSLDLILQTLAELVDARVVREDNRVVFRLAEPQRR